MSSAKKTLSKKTLPKTHKGTRIGILAAVRAYQPAWEQGLTAGRRHAASVRMAVLALMRRPKARNLFALGSVSILALTTVYWSVLSARLQENNADQYVDAYLFENFKTFTTALFPGAHTFFMKWPLFAAMPLFGHGRGVFMVMTILMVLLTVAGLAYVLYRIERRPLFFGLLCLGLASVLLLVPAQPYPGALLPANLAMTTTRNLEYILFIWCLYRFLQLRRLKSVAFAATTVLLAVLVASDKLFGVLALGGLLIVMAASIAVRRRKFNYKVFILPGAATVCGIVLANLLLFLMSVSGLTGVVNEANASPFDFITSMKQLAEGLLYGGLSLLTNFGANPVHDVVIIRELPGALLSRLTGMTGAVYLMNGALFCFALYAAYKVMKSNNQDTATRLTKLLLGTTAASLVVYVLTDHYYPVDSRYTMVSLFALAVAAATYMRHHTLRREIVAASAVLLLLALPVGMLQASREYKLGIAAMAKDTQYYDTVAGILDAKRIKRLVGDYWKIVPIKARMKNEVTVSPVSSCKYTDARPVLVSQSWFTIPRRVPSSYLAVQDPKNLMYQDCTLPRLATLYGTPSERVKLEDNPRTPLRPSVLLLLYGQGIKPLSQVKAPALPEPPKGPQPLQPFSDNVSCSRGTTLNAVAHQDDDLLFLNPDIRDDINDGRCIRTVYVTAGDSGESFGYWGNRERGAKTAYAQMYNVPDEWRDEQRMIGNKTVTVSRLKDAPQVSLVFLRLPDGNRYGEGFTATSRESLRKLLNGQISTVHSVDENVAYSKDQLVEIMRGIMQIDLPDQIRTQYQDDSPQDDHPDHAAVGTITRLASDQYLQPHVVSSYRGYPTRLLAPNLSDDQIAAKQAVFLLYAKFDGAVCQTAEECGLTYTYGNYLSRQYKTMETIGAPSGQ